MPKIVTPADRKREARVEAQKMADAIGYALASDTDPSVTDAERAELWAVVANHAGQVQRRSRILAGLGRGG